MINTNAIYLRNENAAVVKDIALVGLSALLIVLMGQFAVHLPFTPVPISFRFQTVLLLAVLLGSRRGGVSAALFLVFGILGLPAFTNGASGLLPLIGPLGGYYVGFVIAAFVVGYFSEKTKIRTMGRAALIFLAGTLIVYVLGALYLSTFLGLKKALLLGIAPFILGDILKTIGCLKILEWAGWYRTGK